MTRRRYGGSLLAGATLCVAAVGASAQPSDTLSALKQLSIEELSEIPVYSASRHLEPTQGVASAIFVLTNEDIRRARVTTVPDALRLVPGVQVGRVDANKFAVSMRGFNAREANKLLVLVDGRSIYDHLFSGMLWEAQDFLLEDIDRIEVIRGPGGTLWGANAFNGVINIITRHASETVGGYASVAVGDEEPYNAAARYGWEPGENHYVRVYGKAMERDTGFSPTDEPYDALRTRRGGFRWDWTPSERDEWRLSGDVYKADTGVREQPTQVQDIVHSGHNLVARWERTLSDRAAFHVQGYFDHTEYESFGLTQRRDIYDLEGQQSLHAGDRHFFVWGGGARLMRDRTMSGLPQLVDVLPRTRSDEVLTAFVQDTITLVPDTWQLIAGIKYESTDYAESEWLPNLRLTWTPDSQHTWWAAVSEATRVPSRIEADLTFFGSIRVGDGFAAEHVRAYELGTRRLISPRLWYDVAVFYNDYDDLRTSEAGFLRNLMRGHTYGAEWGVRWQPLPNWRLDGTYTWLRMSLELDPTSITSPGEPAYVEGLSPKHQASLRSALDLPRNVQLDTTLRYVDAVPTLDFPSYVELDAAVSWMPRTNIEVSLVGQNLLDSHHPEHDFAFSATGQNTEVERSVHGRVTWRF